MITFKEMLKEGNRNTIENWLDQVKSITKNKWFGKEVAVFKSDSGYKLMFKFTDGAGAIRVSKKIKNLDGMTGSTGGSKVDMYAKDAFGSDVEARVEIRLRADFDADWLKQIMDFTKAKKANNW
jgi:flavodoxin